MSKPEKAGKNVLITNVQFPLEYGLFIAANLLDLFLTMAFIKYGAGEANPLARQVLLSLGQTGFIVYKIALMLVVIGLTEAIARRKPRVARIVIWFAVVILSVVAVSSGIRYYRYMRHPMSGADPGLGRGDTRTLPYSARTVREPSQSQVDRNTTTLKLRGQTVPLRVRGVVSTPEGTSALVDVGGELLAGTSGTLLYLRPSEETCKIAAIDPIRRTVVIERPGYGEANRRISLPFPDAPRPSWKIPHGGLTASLEALKKEYEHGSSVTVRFSLKNTADREVTIETGWKGKPHFWFFMSFAHEGPVKTPPKLVNSRLLDFNYGKGPVKPTKLPPGGTLTFDFDLNKFLEHNIGTPEAMASLPIGRAPASYQVVGLYQMLRPQHAGIWQGSVTSNLISFTVLPKAGE